MARKTLVLISVVLAVLIVSVIPAMAVKQVSREYVQAHESQGILNVFGLWFSQSMRWLSLTMVGGRLCSTYPDESGQCSSGSFCTLMCPSYLIGGGCAIDVYNRDYQFINEVHLSPGQTTTALEGQYWENYYCYIDCTCTNFVDSGCGAGPCSSGYMLRQRACQEQCADEQVCVWNAVCGAPTPVCGNAVCETGETQINCPQDCEAVTGVIIQEYKLPEVTVVGKKIQGTVFFRNSGTSMTDTYIVEMQVRPYGELPLSFISELKTCDPAHPENVHVEFQMDSGDQLIIPVQSSSLDDGSYDVYFMTRDRCWGPTGNTRVEPYYYSYMAGTFTVGTPSDSICNAINCPSPLYRCDGDSCVLNWTNILIIIGVIVIIVGSMAYIVKRRR